MKKIVLISISILFLSGCNSGFKTFSEGNLSFQYPDDMRVSFDDFNPFGDYSTINVKVDGIGDFVYGCAKSWDDYNLTVGQAEKSNIDEYIENYKNILSDIRKGVMNEKVENYDSHCSPTIGSFHLYQTKVNDLNAVIYDKAFAQDVGEMNAFYKEIVFLDNNDRVYSVTLPFGTGEYKHYIESLNGKYGVYPSTDIAEKWYDVYYYLKYGTEIRYDENQDFIEANETVHQIIDSIDLG